MSEGIGDGPRVDMRVDYVDGRPRFFGLTGWNVLEQTLDTSVPFCSQLGVCEGPFWLERAAAVLDSGNSGEVRVSSGSRLGTPLELFELERQGGLPTLGALSKRILALGARIERAGEIYVMQRVPSAGPGQPAAFEWLPLPLADHEEILREGDPLVLLAGRG